MAHAARLAHPAGATLAVVLSLGLALGPTTVQAAPPAATATAGQPTSEPKSPESGAPVEPAPEGDEAKSPEGDAAATAEPEADAPAEVTPEESDEADPAHAEPDEAAPEDPGEGDDATDEDPDAAGTVAGAPEGTVGPTAAPLRPMQTAAWWTMFGAFAVGTTAGVLAGLAERQEDRATRLSTLFDVETGAQPLYADRKDEYEQYLRRGEGYGKAALGVGIVAGVATVAAITLFAIDASRQRREAAPKQKRRASLRAIGGGMEVRF